MKDRIDRRRAIARLARAGAAVVTVCAIPVLPRLKRSSKVRLEKTRISMRIVKLGVIGPADHLAG